LARLVPRLILALGVLLLVGAAVAYAPNVLHSAKPQEASAGQPDGNIRVELTETMLTQQLNQNIGGQPFGPATLDSMTAQLRGGKLQMEGSAKLAGKDVPVSLSSNVSARDGRAVVDVQDARAAGVPVPDQARQSVERALQQQVDQEVSRSGMRVSTVSIADGKLVVTGTRP